ncbi:MAG TPA: YciI family protein [Acidimicrobiales bacterium]|jgi:hypothetical protein|nr:YciI family protein [Acidimicrobiales bacterium]
MAGYAALLYFDAERYWSDPDEAEFTPAYGKAIEAGEAAGILQGPWPYGRALEPPSMATTITVAGGKDGDVMLTDGPYAEAKEVLGGFVLLEAADLDEAIRWAAQLPAAWRGKVEVRPVAPVPGSAPPG